MHAWHDYRRWAFESAALDLALRQAGRSLADAVGRAPRRSLRHLDAARRPALARPVKGSLDLHPSSASSSTPTSDWTTSSSPSWPRPARSTRSTSRATTRARPSTSRPTRRSTGASSRRSRTRGSRTRAHATRRADPRAARGPHHVGRADPLDRRHRGAPVAAEDDQHQALALREPSSRSSTPTTTAPSTGSAPTAAASGSSARAAARSSTSPSLFHPDTPNDVAPGGYNAPEPQPGLPDSPLEPRFRPPASAGRVNVRRASPSTKELRPMSVFRTFYKFLGLDPDGGGRRSRSSSRATARSTPRTRRPAAGP